MNRLEKIYNKACKLLNIDNYDKIADAVEDLYGDYFMFIPEGEILKASPKYTWNYDLSLKLNLCALIERNIGEYVFKKTKLSKLGTYKTGGIAENGTFTIYMETSDDSICPNSVEFGEDIYNVIVSKID